MLLKLIPPTIFFIVIATIVVLYVGMPIYIYLENEEKQHIRDVWGGDVEAYKKYAFGENN
jgi:hypothetical protein